MTKEEAVIVINILLEADGGCPVCAGILIGMFKGSFPKYAEIAEEMYRKEFK